jgi:hypothetical protein
MLNKRNKKLLIGLLVLVLMVGAVAAGSAGAATETVINEDINKAAGSLEIPRSTTVNGNVTLNLGELTVLGVVNGNVNSNMGEVNIAGDVNGNVEANMGQIVISGNVGGDVKARMGEVIVDGSVGGNLTADLGAVNVGGNLGGDIDSGFGELIINGAVAGNVFSKGGNVVINGIVEGDVTLEQGVVELGPEAVVSGRIYVGRGLIEKADSAIVGELEIGEELSAAELNKTVSGTGSDSGYDFDGVDSNIVTEITEEVTNAVERTIREIGFTPHRTGHWPYYPQPFSGFYGGVARGVINMLIMFALAALTYTLFPRQVKRVGAAVSENTGPVVGWGILAVVLAIPLAILLAITLVGIPLIIVEVAVFAAAAILGYAGIAGLIGGKIIESASNKTVNPLAAIAIGVLVIGLTAMIPIIGALVSLAVYTLAIGATLVTRFGATGPEETVIMPRVEEN